MGSRDLDQHTLRWDPRAVPCRQQPLRDIAEPLISHPHPRWQRARWSRFITQLHALAADTTDADRLHLLLRTGRTATLPLTRARAGVREALTAISAHSTIDGPRTCDCLTPAADAFFAELATALNVLHSTCRHEDGEAPTFSLIVDAHPDHDQVGRSTYMPTAGATLYARFDGPDITAATGCTVTFGREDNQPGERGDARRVVHIDIGTGPDRRVYRLRHVTAFETMLADLLHHPCANPHRDIGARHALVITWSPDQQRAAFVLSRLSPITRLGAGCHPSRPVPLTVPPGHPDLSCPQHWSGPLAELANTYDRASLELANRMVDDWHGTAAELFDTAAAITAAAGGAPGVTEP